MKKKISSIKLNIVNVQINIMRFKYLLSFYVLLYIFLITGSKSLAAPPSMNVAFTPQLMDKEIKDGDILTFDQKLKGLVRTKEEFDQMMFGVAQEFPAIVIRTQETIPVVRAGTAKVNVTTLEGPIQPGDFITSSPITGKGQRASGTGYMLGIAMSDFTDKDGKPMDYKGKKITEGQVKVEVGIGPASPVIIKATGGLFGTLMQLSTSLFINLFALRQFDRILRFILAALVAIVIIYINFRTFSKNITKGIEAIGRNPLARVSIQSMIIMNVVLVIIVTLGGVILSLAILSL